VSKIIKLKLAFNFKTDTVCVQGAMSAYNTAVSILKNNVGIEIPPEIYNNMAALHFWQGNLDEAKVTVVTELSQARRQEMKWGVFL